MMLLGLSPAGAHSMSLEDVYDKLKMPDKMCKREMILKFNVFYDHVE